MELLKSLKTSFQEQDHSAVIDTLWSALIPLINEISNISDILSKEEANKTLDKALSLFTPKEVFLLCLSSAGQDSDLDKLNSNNILRMSNLLSQNLPLIKVKRTLFFRDGFNFLERVFERRYMNSRCYDGEEATNRESVIVLKCICKYVETYLNLDDIDSHRVQESISFLFRVAGDFLVKCSDDLFFEGCEAISPLVLKSYKPEAHVYSFFNAERRKKRVLSSNAVLTTLFESDSESDENDYWDLIATQDLGDGHDYDHFYSPGMAAFGFYIAKLKSNGNPDALNPISLIVTQMPFAEDLMNRRDSQIASLRGVEYAGALFTDFIGMELLQLTNFGDGKALLRLFHILLDASVSFPQNTNRLFVLSTFFEILTSFNKKARLHIVSKLIEDCSYQHVSALLIDGLRKEASTAKKSELQYIKSLSNKILFEMNADSILENSDKYTAILVLLQFLLMKAEPQDDMQKCKRKPIKDYVALLLGKVSEQAETMQRSLDEYQLQIDECSASFVKLRPSFDFSTSCQPQRLTKRFPRPPKYGNDYTKPSDPQQTFEVLQSGILKLNLVRNAVVQLQEKLEDL